jgi:polar amino acid transport system substrate-binding protein
MKRFSALLVFLMLVTTQAASSTELTVLTENLPPGNFVRDGELVGSSVEIVKEIQKRVGSSVEILVYPWARAYRMALEDENIVLFGMTYTEERHDKFKWVGPLATKRDILVAKKGSEIKIDTLEDAKKVERIGTLRDDTRERFLKQHEFTNLESVSDEQLNARKLIRGRIDLWAYKIPGLKTVCELAGIDYDEVEEIYSLREIDISIAFSKKTPDALVQTWRKAFNDMLADGTISRIRNKWSIE